MSIIENKRLGQHWRLDLDALLAGVARTIRRANPDKDVRQVRQSDIDAFGAPIRSGVSTRATCSA